MEKKGRLLVSTRALRASAPCICHFPFGWLLALEGEQKSEERDSSDRIKYNNGGGRRRGETTGAAPEIDRECVDLRNTIDVAGEACDLGASSHDLASLISTGNTCNFRRLCSSICLNEPSWLNLNISRSLFWTELAIQKPATASTRTYNPRGIIICSCHRIYFLDRRLAGNTAHCTSRILYIPLYPEKDPAFLARKPRARYHSIMLQRIEKSSDGRLYGG
jgi:hypothetical protein